MSLIFVCIVNVATTAEVGAAVTSVQSVAINTKRISDEDKFPYDLEIPQMVVMQVVEVCGSVWLLKK